ncbi:MAG: hypothetical protein Q9227_007250 [Pyrenula ochraceoflavens]
MSTYAGSGSLCLTTGAASNQQDQSVRAYMAAKERGEGLESMSLKKESAVKGDLGEPVAERPEEDRGSDEDVKAASNGERGDVKIVVSDFGDGEAGGDGGNVDGDSGIGRPLNDDMAIEVVGGEEGKGRKQGKEALGIDKANLPTTDDVEDSEVRREADKTREPKKRGGLSRMFSKLGRK